MSRMLELTADNPLVRTSSTCPLCEGDKPRGLLACWPCYRQHGMKYGNEAAEQLIAEREAELALGLGA